MEFIKKLQQKPEPVKKRILWITIIIIAIIFAIIWIFFVNYRVRQIKKQDVLEEFNIPGLKEELKSLKNND